MKASPDFLPLLNAHKIEELDRQSITALGTWPDLTLAYLNQGWITFARQNGGVPERWGLGTSLVEVIPAVMLPFFSEQFMRVLREGRPWRHDYECSSPERMRIFHMIVYPLGSGQGLLMIHSLRRDSKHAPGPSKFSIVDYEDKDGLIHHCAHCRRVRRIDDASVWDWVPELVRNPKPNTSHGLCIPCFGYYYNENRQDHPAMFSTTEDME
jgi:hypothetical protein